MFASRRAPNRTAALTVVAAALTVLTSSVVAAPAATASTPGWQRQTNPRLEVKGGRLASVSCPATSPGTCFAVGTTDSVDPGENVPATDRYTALAAVHSGRGAWTSMALPHAAGTVLSAVSCSSATACTAVGHTQNTVVVYRWNGRTWARQHITTPVGARLSAVSCASATACLAVGTANLYALAEAWNGHNWTAFDVTEPSNTHDSGFLGVSCTAPTSCTAVGGSDTNSARATFIEHLNPLARTSTVQVSAQSSTDVLAGVSCTSTTACIAIGWSTLPADGGLMAFSERWNGTTWASVAVPTPPVAHYAVLQSVSCVTATACTAVGYDSPIAGSPDPGDKIPLVEHWNGSSWTFAAAANPAGGTSAAFAGVSCNLATSCTAVGTYIGREWLPKTLAEQSTGSGWTISATPNTPVRAWGALAAISCPAAQACFAVGQITFAGTKPHDDFVFDDVDVPLAARWNGTTWTTIQVPLPKAAQSAELSGVSCLSATSCEAVGSFKYPGAEPNSFAPPHSFAERWDGKHWTVQSTPNPNGTETSGLLAVSCSSATACTAVGHYSIAEDRLGHPIDTALIERWNGTAWSPQPSAAHVARLKGVSCAAAEVCTAVGVYRSGAAVEQWTGTSWTIQRAPQPSAAESSELAGVACTSATHCLAVGHYVRPNTFGDDEYVGESRLWNGTTWKTVGSFARGTSYPGEFGLPDAVSCASATSCIAVGSLNGSPSAYRWGGKSWTATSALPTYRDSSLTGVSCVAAARCEAVGYLKYPSSNALYVGYQ